MIDVFNAMNIDLVVPGNHEFDYGPKELKKRIAESKFEWIATNVLEADRSSVFLGCLPYKIVQVEDFKVGFFGITTHETCHLSFPGDTIFGHVVTTSQKVVQLLKEKGADVIIAITHQSLPEDQELAKKVLGINLIIGGHEHSPFTIFEGDTMIHKSGQNANFLGRIDINIERLTSNKLDVTFTWKMLTNKGYTKDPSVANVIQKYMTQLLDLKKENIAKMLTTLDSKTESVRSKEASFGNMLADAVRERTGTDIAIVQGGAIRGDSFYEAGTVLTALDLNRELPFANVISVYKIKGQDLRDALEEGIKNLPNRAGCFPQVSGLRLTVDPKQPALRRVLKVEVNDKELDPQQYYTVTSTTFIRNGGDGYLSLTKAEDLKHDANESLLSTILLDYLLKYKEVSPKVEGRITML